MNNSTPASFVPDLLRDLRAFTAVGEEALALAASEHQALSRASNYEAFEFHRSRKDLLIRLEPLTMGLKHWRQIWQQLSPLERSGYSDVIDVIQMLQNLLVKTLQLDRENQQALLRRGLVPARHINACSAPPSNFVATLYRRHNPQ